MHSLYDIVLFAAGKPLPLYFSVCTRILRITARHVRCGLNIRLELVRVPSRTISCKCHEKVRAFIFENSTSNYPTSHSLKSQVIKHCVIQIQFTLPLSSFWVVAYRSWQYGAIMSNATCILEIEPISSNCE